MKLIQTHIIYTLACLVLFGCVKDRGNYSEIAVPELAIKSYSIYVNDKKLTAEQSANLLLNTNDNLKIEFEEDQINGITPTYQWMIYEIDPVLKPGSTLEAAQQIGTTKNLDQKFGKGPGKYKLFRKLINSNNNDAYFTEFNIIVESINGLLVYQVDGNGTGDYSMLRTSEMNLGLPEDRMGVRHAIYSSINASHPIKNPSHLWIRQTGSANYDDQIFAISQQGWNQINYRTHIWEHANKESVFAFPLEGDFNPLGHMMGSNKIEYLIQNGEVYNINYMTGPSMPKFIPLSENGMFYSPYMMTIPTDMQTFRMYSNIVFNQTLQRFEYDNFNYLMSFFPTQGPLGSEDVDISNTMMQLLYMEKGKDFSICAVMKDNDGKIHFIRFDITDPMASICSHHIDLSSMSNTVQDNSLWAISERGSFAFFATGNKVYLLNYEQQTITPIVNDIPGDAQISALKILKGSSNPAYDNAVLYVTYNQGLVGTLQQYEFNPLSGQLKSSSKKTFTGFNKIIDLIFKK